MVLHTATSDAGYDNNGAMLLMVLVVVSDRRIQAVSP
jgi:hypothetical protein